MIDVEATDEESTDVECWTGVESSVESIDVKCLITPRLIQYLNK